MAEEIVHLSAITAYRCDDCGEGWMLFQEEDAPAPSIELVGQPVQPHRCSCCRRTALLIGIYYYGTPGQPATPREPARAKTLHLKCDLKGMVRQAAAMLPESAQRAGLEQLLEHIDQVRAGTATVDEFADFYLLRPETK